MHGNVAEWCADWYGLVYYGESPVANPRGPAAGNSRVVRGGSWADQPGSCRSAFRDSYWTNKKSGAVGFRVAAEINEAPPLVAAKPADAPPLAAAPFNTSGAEAHQQAWAKYLDVPVEKDVDIYRGTKMTFVLIPPGEFSMGSDGKNQVRLLEEAIELGDEPGRELISNEAPQHPVTITQPFYLGKFEMTQAQWQAVMGKNPAQFTDATKPVESVSWHAIQALLDVLNQEHAAAGAEFRLPTEAQWEYACASGTTTDFYHGDSKTDLPEFARFGQKEESAGTQAIGQLRPNAWGLHDMLGNVGEWCADCYQPDTYYRSGRYDPIGVEYIELSRNFRGGSWNKQATRCRTRFRDYEAPNGARNYIGLRLVLTRPLAPGRIEREVEASP